ncbi:AAA family ATPase [Clostridium sp. P21]|uniref:AAA family ATPase n=1 Tax=Clostridium muellerianum TaxID=2716538 RepID=A0A7Y0HQL0_9CLOT|nr:AAA family ATPase [Clostridium muellerianum]NMM65235.1 AAA family ATPase [Clostridium muellerianum]
MIKTSEWKQSIEDYISWKIGVEYIERLKVFNELFEWLENNNFSVGSKHSTYTYINKNIKEFRANIYYKKIGIAKITLRINFDNLNEDVIIINKINKMEHDCYRLKDISSELDSLWTQLSKNSNFYVPQDISNSSIYFLSKLINYINDYIFEEKEIKFLNASQFLYSLLHENIINIEELNRYDNEPDINVIIKIINEMKNKKIYKIYEIGWYLTVNYEYFNDRVSSRFKYGNLKKNQYASKYILRNQNIFNEISKYVKIDNQDDGFKLVSLDISSGFLNGSLIKHDLNNYMKDRSMYSIFIGKNGTGKTQALRAIERIFQGLYFLKYNNKDIFEFDFNLKYMKGNNLFEVLRKNSENLFKFDNNNISISQVEIPTKLLASSYMINDKFSFQSFNNPDYDEENQFYEYLGVRDATNASHTTTISKRLVLNIIKSVRKLEFRKGFKSILKYLELNNEIKINFQINSEFISVNGLKENDVREKLGKKSAEILPDEIEIYIDYLNKIISMGFQVQNSKNTTFGVSYQLFMGQEEQLETYNEIELVYELLKLNILHMPTIEIKKNNFYNVESASSGENHFLFTMINILTYIKKNSLILIDEPEISLHPNWQYKFIAVLNDIFSHYNSHFIIATHSHFIISDLPPRQSSIIRFDIDNNGRFIVENEDSETFGWSAENILYNIFHMKTVRNYYLEADLLKVLKLISSDSKNYNLINDILVKLKRLTLRDEDPLKNIISQVEDYLNELHTKD